MDVFLLIYFHVSVVLYFFHQCHAVQNHPSLEKLNKKLKNTKYNILDYMSFSLDLFKVKGFIWCR